MTFVFAISYASGAPGATGRMSRRRSRVERRADLTSVRPTPPMRLLIEDFERPPTMRVGRRRCVRDSTPAQLSATWGPSLEARPRQTPSSSWRECARARE